MSNSGRTRRGGRPDTVPVRDDEEAEVSSAEERDGEGGLDDGGAGASVSGPVSRGAALAAAQQAAQEAVAAREEAVQELAALRQQAAEAEAILRAQLLAAEERAAAAAARATAEELRTRLARPGPGVASAPSGMSVALDATRVKLPEMATYSGRVEENLDSWLRDAGAMVEFQGLGAGDRAVKWMALYLKGDAQEWWQGGAKAAVATVAELEDALHQRFQPPQSAQVARKLVSDTKQGGDGVAAYASRFQSVAARVPGGMGDAEQVFAFTNGLRHALAVEVVKQGCTTLQKAIQAAIMQESLARTVAGAGTGSRPRGAAGLNAIDTEDPDAEAEATDTPVTMAVLLTAIRAMGAGAGMPRGAAPSGRPGPRRKKLSPDERKRRRDNNLCFNCARPGHPARECSSAFIMGPPGGAGTDMGETAGRPAPSGQKNE
jgi:hypothetical protein